MKKLLLFLAVLVSLNASAYKINYVAPSTEIPYWMADIRNDAYEPGQPTFIFLPGIGERVNANYSLSMAEKQGTKAATEKVVRWITDSSWSLPASVEYYKSNIVTFAPKWEYESGEIQMAIKYAREVQKAGKVIFITNSLGQFGLSIQCDKFPDLPKSFDALISFVSGNGERTNTAKNIAAAKLPCWFFTAENDIASNTTPQATINLHKSIIAAGGVSWLTVLKAGQYPDKYAHQIISLIIPINKKIGTGNILTTAAPLKESGINNIITLPNLNIYQWALLNSRDQSFSPDYIAPVPVLAPIPKIDTVALPVQIGIARAVANCSTVRFSWLSEKLPSSSLQIWWKDGTSDIYSAPAGMRCAGVTIDAVVGGNKYTLDIRNDKNEKQPAIIVGPYK